MLRLFRRSNLERHAGDVAALELAAGGLRPVAVEAGKARAVVGLVALDGALGVGVGLFRAGSAALLCAELSRSLASPSSSKAPTWMTQPPRAGVAGGCGRPRQPWRLERRRPWRRRPRAGRRGRRDARRRCRARCCGFGRCGRRGGLRRRGCRRVIAAGAARPSAPAPAWAGRASPPAVLTRTGVIGAFEPAAAREWWRWRR